jgi:hypothetical protein
VVSHRDKEAESMLWLLLLLLLLLMMLLLLLRLLHLPLHKMLMRWKRKQQRHGVKRTMIHCT